VPRISPLKLVAQGCASRAAYAVFASVWAVAAAAGPTIVPRVTVGKPVTAVPGLTPTSPVTTVAPVLVTVVAPRTAKLCAAPSGGADCAHAKLPIPSMQITNKSLFISKLLGWTSFFPQPYCRRSSNHCLPQYFVISLV